MDTQFDKIELVQFMKLSQTSSVKSIGLMPLQDAAKCCEPASSVAGKQDFPGRERSGVRACSEMSAKMDFGSAGGACRLAARFRAGLVGPVPE